MATLPNDYGRRPTPQDRGQAVPTYGGSATGEAIQGVARVAQGALDEHAKARQRIQDREDADALFQTETALKTEYLQFERGELDKLGQNAKGVGDRSKQWWADAKGRHAKNLANERQRRLFDQAVTTAELSGSETLIRHESKQRRDSLLESAGSRISTAIDMARADPSDARVAAAYAEIGSAVEATAELNGWAPDVAKAEKAQAVERMSKQISSDAYGRAALELDNGGDPRKSVNWERMDSGHQAILTNRINSEEQQRQARAIAAQERRQRDAEKALDDLSKYAATGSPMSGQYEDSIRETASLAGPQYKARAEELIRVAQNGSGFGAQTLPRQAAALGALEQKLQTGGSDPETQTQFAALRRMHDEQKREYAENPWAAAQRFGRAVDATPAPLGDLSEAVQLFAGRMKQISAVEAMSGGPESPLQPDEAKAVGSLMDAADPPAQAQFLAEASAGLNPGQIAKLGAQLGGANKAYGIALKVGAGKTLAGRNISEFVLRGARGLRDKTVKRDDAALTGWRAELSEEVSGAMGSDEAEREIMDAAYYVMAAQDLDGIKSPGFSRGIGSGAKDAVALVAGLPIKRAGLKTLLPRGMSEDQFDDAMQGAAATQIKDLTPTGKVYLRGQEVDFATQVLPRLYTYGLQRDRLGRFIPVSRNAAFTLDPGGTLPLAIRVP